MIEIGNIYTSGWPAAIHGMRNPMNSWEKSDSHYEKCQSYECPECEYSDVCAYDLWYDSKFTIGINDLKLMRTLVKAGTDHSKFLRMIHVQMDVNAPMYWWKEFDTYKVATVRNSCSTMHKIQSKEFTMDDFSTDHLNDLSKNQLAYTITALNYNRDKWHEVDAADKKDYWWQMIQLLPSSYNQLSTIDLNYQVLRTIRNSDRKTHKLDEWRDFCAWIDTLPYADVLLVKGDDND